VIRSAGFKRAPARPARQYEGANPSMARPTVVSIISTANVLVIQIEKTEILRSESYRRFVAAQACFGCGIEGYSQAAHPNFGKGMAFKTSDALCFPLCGPRMGMPGCHANHDQRASMGRDENREIEAAYTARMQRIARSAGRKEIA
jgi:hypothetical protein